jgi:hypothetical protein
VAVLWVATFFFLVRQMQWQPLYALLPSDNSRVRRVAFLGVYFHPTSFTFTIEAKTYQQMHRKLRL